MEQTSSQEKKKAGAAGNPEYMDFTEGGIAGKMVRFAAPVFAGNVLQASYQFVDSMWIGNLLGAEALGAHAVSAPVIFAILSFMIGINSATLTVLSQQKGKKDEGGIRRSLNAFVFILGSMTLFLGAVGFFLAAPLLKLLGTPEELLAPANVYLQINFVGIVFLFGYNFIGTVLRALGNSRAPVRFIVMAVVLNAVLDPLLISVFGLGMAGAAIATVIAQGAAFLYGVVYSLRTGAVPFSVPTVPEKKYARAVFKLGLPGGLQMIAISSGIVVMMSVVNSFGKEVVAGFGAAQRLESLIMIPAMTLGSVVNSMAGQNIGAGRWERVSGIARTGTVFILICSFTIGAAVFLGADHAIRWFVDDPGTVAFGTAFLQTVAFFYPFLGINFVLNGVARSAGAMLPVLVLNIISFWVLRFPLVFFCSQIWGEVGIAYGVASSFVISSGIAAWYYRFGGWRRARVFD